MSDPVVTEIRSIVSKAWQAVGGIGYIVDELAKQGDITPYGRVVLKADLDDIAQALGLIDPKQAQERESLAH